MKTKSLLFLLLCYLIVGFTHFVFYPKWKQKHTEATLSWDVSGYYMYLPATFIYKDLKKCAFHQDILKKYRPTPNFQQAFIHKESGNYVMKYSIGQAIQFSPFFFIAHTWAKASSKYEADGFSFPYQFSISMGSFLVMLIGLYFAQKILLIYFDETTAGLSLLALILGSNYLNYAAIDGAMTHNHLFTIYAILIYTTIQFYKKPNAFKAFLIGLLVGMAALTRPTEIIACLIPLLWGIESIGERLKTFQKYLPLLLIAIITCLAVGSIQFFYWKYVSGDWIVYSYEDQGFSWLSPHIREGMFSYKSGWLVYSPLMIFSLIGFYFLYQQHKKLYPAVWVFSFLFIYIAFAWDEWLYGGALGQRAMVQAYAILLFPLASFIDWWRHQKNGIKISLGILMGIFCYMSLWFTYQGHKGGVLHVGQMTNAYYWKTLGRFERNPEHRKLLDTNEFYDGERKNMRLFYENDFENIKKSICESNKNGVKNTVICLNKENEYSPNFEFEIPKDFDWIRASADFDFRPKEWNVWKMTQFIVEFYKGENKVKKKMIRLQRLIDGDGKKELFIEVKKPKKDFDKVRVFFWNADSDHEIWIDNLKVEGFDVK